MVIHVSTRYWRNCPSPLIDDHLKHANVVDVSRRGKRRLVGVTASSFPGRARTKRVRLACSCATLSLFVVCARDQIELATHSNLFAPPFCNSGKQRRVHVFVI